MKVEALQQNRGDIFGDTTIAAAMLDRLLHRCAVINIVGDSYRLRAHQARNRQHTALQLRRSRDSASAAAATL